MNLLSFHVCIPPSIIWTLPDISPYPCMHVTLPLSSTFSRNDFLVLVAGELSSRDQPDRITPEPTSSHSGKQHTLMQSHHFTCHIQHPVSLHITGERPSLPELLRLEIPQHVATKYESFGSSSSMMRLGVEWTAL